MPKRKVLKNRKEEQEQPQQEHGEEVQQQQSTSTTNELQKQPPRKLTQIINGQQRRYHYLKTVKSLDELDKFRFKVIYYTQDRIIFYIVIRITANLLVLLSRANGGIISNHLLYHAQGKELDYAILN
jgi:hypothetical protein